MKIINTFHIGIAADTAGARAHDAAAVAVGIRTRNFSRT